MKPYRFRSPPYGGYCTVRIEEHEIDFSRIRFEWANRGYKWNVWVITFNPDYCAWHVDTIGM